MIINLSKDSDYHTQRNNKFYPHSSCNTTSAIMMLKAAGTYFDFPAGMQEEDYLTNILESKEAYDVMRARYPWAIRDGYRPAEVHMMLEWGITKLVGRQVTKFTTNISIRELLYKILQGQPSLITGKFTKYGHIVCLVGFETLQRKEEFISVEDIKYDQLKNIIIDDPYGNYHTGYSDHRGNNTTLTFEEFNAITKTYNMEDSKWAHIFLE